MRGQGGELTRTYVTEAPRCTQCCLACWARLQRPDHSAPLQTCAARSLRKPLAQDTHRLHARHTAQASSAYALPFVLFDCCTWKWPPPLLMQLVSRHGDGLQSTTSTSPLRMARSPLAVATSHHWHLLPFYLIVFCSPLPCAFAVCRSQAPFALRTYNTCTRLRTRAWRTSYSSTK